MSSYLECFFVFLLVCLVLSFVTCLYTYLGILLGIVDEIKA